MPGNLNNFYVTRNTDERIYTIGAQSCQTALPTSAARWRSVVMWDIQHIKAIHYV